MVYRGKGSNNYVQIIKVPKTLDSSYLAMLLFLNVIAIELLNMMKKKHMGFVVPSLAVAIMKSTGVFHTVQLHLMCQNVEPKQSMYGIFIYIYPLK